MKLRFTRRAIQDLTNIADYIRERNPQGARRVRAAVVESLRTLVLFPHIGRRQKVEGVRKIVTRRYPYLIYYTLDGNIGRNRDHRDSTPGSPTRALRYLKL